MLLKRDPWPALRPFVKSLWVTQSSQTSPATVSRERVLPTGDMHVVFRLRGPSLRLFLDASGTSSQTLGTAVIGGPRATFYVREVVECGWSVGAQLLPAASEYLFGVPARELAGRHTSLEDVWGRACELAREQLLESRDPARQLDVLEMVLARRLPSVRALHPAVAQALQTLRVEGEVSAAVEASGYSHRRFIELFRRHIGLTPKVFARVLRFQKVLDSITGRAASFANLAFAAGYSDQSHFTREFREFAGVSPGEYRRLAPRQTHHVPVHKREV